MKSFRILNGFLGNLQQQLRTITTTKKKIFFKLQKKKKKRRRRREIEKESLFNCLLLRYNSQIWGHVACGMFQVWVATTFAIFIFQLYFYCSFCFRCKFKHVFILFCSFFLMFLVTFYAGPTSNTHLLFKSFRTLNNTGMDGMPL